MFAPERREPKPVIEIRFSDERSFSKSDSSSNSITCGKSELLISRDMASIDRRRSCRSSGLKEREKEARDFHVVEEGA